MQSKLGVAVWGTGNMGATAIRSVTAFPGSASDGRHHVVAGQGRQGRGDVRRPGLRHRGGGHAPTSTPCWRDCDAVAYMASGDIRPDEAVADIERCLRAGKHVVTPSLYSLYDPRVRPAGVGRPAHRGRRGRRRDAARQRRRPRLGQRRARGDRRGPVHPHHSPSTARRSSTTRPTTSRTRSRCRAGSAARWTRRR